MIEKNSNLNLSQKKKTNKINICSWVSLSFGIASPFTCLWSIPAIVLGIISLIYKSKLSKAGIYRAIIGISLGLLMILFDVSPIPKVCAIEKLSFVMHSYLTLSKYESKKVVRYLDEYKIKHGKYPERINIFDVFTITDIRYYHYSSNPDLYKNKDKCYMDKKILDNYFKTDEGYKLITFYYPTRCILDSKDKKWKCYLI